ncbi:MAG: PorV/PorQ family protein [candidate division WOR-3 bacterium]|nr:PorV/PorQ family protein [candidate division WOR-3 bacterium]
MRRMAIAALLALGASIVSSAQASEIGMGVLMIWPTARSTALASAMTGLADEADATYFNPAGLAFQTTAKADLNYGNWLPGLYQGMYYASAAGGAPLRLPFLHGRNAFVAGSLTYMTVGETDIVNERGDFLGRVNAWRASAALHSGIALSQKVGLGLTVKLAHSEHALDYGWSWATHRPDPPETGLEAGGTATCAAFDAGVHYKPLPQLSVGLSVANLGPAMSYLAHDWLGPYTYEADMPRMARLGLCWMPVESHLVRLRIMPELDKVLVGMFSDTTGKSFGRQLTEEWQDVWKVVGVETTAFGLVSLRLGYFEDLTNQRGGLVYEKQSGYTEHYGLGDVLTRKNLGKFERVGLCWGLGFGSDKLRFDFSSDAAIYDFPTKNWKFQLVSNDIGGLFGRKS